MSIEQITDGPIHSSCSDARAMVRALMARIELSRERIKLGERDTLSEEERRVLEQAKRIFGGAEAELAKLKDKTLA